MPTIVISSTPTLIRGIESFAAPFSDELQLPAETVHQHLHQPELRDLLLGQLDESLFWQTVIDRFRWNTTAPVVQHRFRQHLHAVPEMIGLIEALNQRGVTILVLHHLPAPWVQHIEQTHPELLKHAERTWNTAALRLHSTDPQLYRTLAAETSKAPSSLLYIDTEEERLRAAAASGFRIQHATTPYHLRRALQAQGYLSL
jgi:FMN phosphatase YigB (HAD superfamily)